MSIVRFYEPKAPFYEFSNFYDKSKFVLDGEEWATTEQYFQCQKFMVEGSRDHLEYMNIIKQADTPMKIFLLARQKKQGGYGAKWVVNKKTYPRKVNEVVEMYSHIRPREDWDEVKLMVMYKALHAKFSQHSKLKALLLSTYPRKIEEASPRDWYWGMGKDETGKNWLGRLLMDVRKNL